MHRSSPPTDAARQTVLTAALSRATPGNRVQEALLPRARRARPHGPGTGSQIDHVLVIAPRIPVPSLRSFS